MKLRRFECEAARASKSSNDLVTVADGLRTSAAPLASPG